MKLSRITSLVVLLLIGRATAEEGAGLLSPVMVGSDARALAMGRASVAIARDAETLFWNPARLTALERGDFSLYRSQLYEDGIVYHSAFLAYPTLEMGTFGLGYQTIGAGDLVRSDDRNTILGDFDTRESHLLLGYGRELQARLAVGATFRLVQQRVADFSGTGFGIDLGASWWKPIDALGRHRVLTGIDFVNLMTPSIRLDEEEVSDPRVVRLGLGYEGENEGGFTWTAATDLEMPSQGDGRFGAGVEFGYQDLVFLRGGIEQNNPSLGFGIEWSSVRLDYAMRTHDELSRNDRLTIGVRFGSSVPARLEQRRAAAEQRVESLLADRLQAREDEARTRSMAEAVQARDRGDFEAARRLYRRVLALEPHHERAARGLDEVELLIELRTARAEMETGAFARASAAYQAILDRWPASDEAQTSLREARVALDAASNRQEQLAELFGSALSLFSDGDLLGARRSLEELLRLDPNHELGKQLFGRVESMRKQRGDALLAEAKRRHRSGDFQSALKALAEASSLLSERDDLDALAVAWRKDWAAAEAAAERDRLAAVRKSAGSAPSARQPEPLSAADRDRLGRLFAEGLERFTAGDFEGATRRWHAVWTERPDFESVGEYLVKAYLFEGLQLYGQGAYDAAIGRCRRVLEIDPSHSKARRYLARIEEERAEIQGAEEARR